MTFDVVNQWDGSVNPRSDVRASVSFESIPEGLRIRASMPRRSDENIPDVPPGRIANLWEYDVAELFLVGEGHNYLEIELGAGGHFLILGFDEIRHRSNEYLDFDPQVVFVQTETEWSAECVIPSSMVPSPLRAANAFVIASGLFLAASPVPGEQPNFHQPDAFPRI